MARSGWISPFLKQCFVTAGVSMTLAQFSVVVGFTAVLLPQLRGPDSIIQIDDSSESWIAAIPGLALAVGSFMVPTIMAKYGRKIALLICIVSINIAWISITLAKSVLCILIARLIQGIALGMINALAPIMIGEYTSANNRGMFLTTLALLLATGALIVHTVGSYLSWHATAIICSIITFINVLIVAYSPETPTWLADQGRYEECKRVFRWLRREDEEDELNKMIETSAYVRESKVYVNVSETFTMKTKKRIAYLSGAIRKKEFYMPIFIMIHVFIFGNWSGPNIITPYMLDIIDNIVGEEINIPVLVISIDLQRLITAFLTVFIVKKVKRRIMLLTTMGLCLTVLLATGAYTYAKAQNMLPFDHPVIGAFLIHFHMLTIAVGASPLPLIISGEIFPTEFRSLSTGISCVFHSFYFFLSIKTFPYILKTLGIYGAYCLYAGMVGYSIMIVWLFLPETKDRTLQDIEEEFRGSRLSTRNLRIFSLSYKL